MILLLCRFHQLQAHWSWLWAAKNGIKNEDRPILLRLFRKLVYAETDHTYKKEEKILLKHPQLKKYPNYATYVKQILTRKDEWSLVFRIEQNLPTNNQETSNLVETSFRSEKEDKFKRFKAYNLTDMVRIVLDGSEDKANRCVDAANQTLHQRLKNQKSKYLVRKTAIDSQKIEKVDENTYKVPSETKLDVFYIVNLELRTCTCPMGSRRGPCKHKSLVSKGGRQYTIWTFPTFETDS